MKDSHFYFRVSWFKGRMQRDSNGETVPLGPQVEMLNRYFVQFVIGTISIITISTMALPVEQSMRISRRYPPSTDSKNYRRKRQAKSPCNRLSHCYIELVAPTSALSDEDTRICRAREADRRFELLVREKQDLKELTSRLTRIRLEKRLWTIDR